MLTLISSGSNSSWYTWYPQEQRLRLHLHIQPGAKQTEVVGLYGDSLKIRLAAPPVDGKANKALITFLAKTLAISRQQIQIVRGETGREKTIEIHGFSKTQP